MILFTFQKGGELGNEQKGGDFPEHHNLENQEEGKMKGKELIIGILAILLIAGAFTDYGYGQTFKWRAQTYAVPGTVGFKSQEIALQHLKEATAGRLEVKLHGTGVLVGAFESLEACGKGVFEAVHHPDAFAAGLDPGFAPIFSAIGLWDDPREVRMWIEGFGGKKIMRDSYAKYKVHYAGSTLIGAEPIMSKVPLRKLEDFKGVKIRTPAGLTSMLFAKLGASPVPLPGGEIYTALDTGVIRAAEFVTLSENFGAGLHEVSKYVLWPSFHGPIAVVNWGVNQEAWNKLPNDLKAAFEMMVYEADYLYDIMSAVADNDALKKMVAKGLEHNQLSPADMEKVKKLSMEVALEYKKKSPLSDQVISSIIDFLKVTGKVK
jgi:TRAP-type mannitol/chloroaromatic compound transport system substrate-binding protein